ncbi:MAG: DNA-directed RNA polymerase subunit D [Candidatus Poseidoniaceae archaeon]
MIFEVEKMDVQIVDGWPNGNAIRILLTNTDAAQVNAIRRALIADVPKLAIDRVNFDQGTHQDNKGQVFESVNVLPDETIAHRLAMIPVPTYPDEGITFPEDCPTCKDMAEESKGCMTCQVLYHIRKEGPSEDSDEEYRTVYAGDLTTISDQMFDIREEHKRIPLTILSKGQYLEFYAFATLGRGRDHAKWSPVAAVGFRQYRIATLNKPKKAKILFDLDLTTTDGKPIDAKLFGKDKKLTDVNYLIDLENALHQVGEGTNRDGEFDDAITMEPVEGAYVFTYETDGSLTPEQAFNGAMKELQGRFDNLSSEIERAFA